MTRTRLALEPLNDRTLPATIAFAGGVLAVSNPTVVGGASTVTINQTFPNTFVVVDSGVFSTPVTGVSQVRYTGGPANDTVQVFLAGFDYSGSFAFATGAGGDLVEINGGAGSIGRGVTVTPGPGNDTVNLNGAPGAGRIDVFGPVRVTDAAGFDAVYLGNGGAVSQFLGNTTLQGVNQVRLGFGQPDVFRNVTATVAGDANALDFRTSNTPVSVGVYGNLRLTGGPGDDYVLDSSVLVTGNAAINLGGTTVGGGNHLSLWAGVPGLHVNGNLTYTGGPGRDELYLSGYQVVGNATVALGGGPDTLDLSTLTSGTQPRVTGDLTITGGAGTVNFNGLFLDGVTVAVGGDFRVTLGAGPQTMRVTTAPGGVFRWTSGAGADTLSFIPALAGQFWEVQIHLGAGNDLLSLGGGGPGQTITGSADFGGQTTTDTFIQGLNWVTLPGWVMTNLP